MRIFGFLVFLIAFCSCANSNEKESYKIYNTVLQEKVSTYGIMHHYLPYDRKCSTREIERIAREISDSLKTSRSLSFFLYNELTILDTLNPADEFDIGEALVEFRPKYSKNKIDFAKIIALDFAIRMNKPLPIDENKKNPTYLGDYDLSEPVFISKNKAVIRYQHHCGGRCGIGILIYLQKSDGNWKIIHEKEIWIS